MYEGFHFVNSSKMYVTKTLRLKIMNATAFPDAPHIVQNTFQTAQMRYIGKFKLRNIIPSDYMVRPWITRHFQRFRKTDIGIYCFQRFFSVIHLIIFTDSVSVFIIRIVICIPKLFRSCRHCAHLNDLIRLIVLVMRSVKQFSCFIRVILGFINQISCQIIFIVCCISQVCGFEILFLY